VASDPLKPIRLHLFQSVARTLRKWADQIAPEDKVAEHHGAGGPPQDWVERVRQGAPELLLRPEEGGVSPQFAQEMQRGVQDFLPKRPAPRSSQALHEAPPRPARQEQLAQQSALPTLGVPEPRRVPEASRHEDGRLPLPDESRSDVLSEYRTSFGKSRGPRQQERPRAGLQAKPSDTRKDHEGPTETSERKRSESVSSWRIARALERARRVGRQLLGRRATPEVSGSAKTPAPLEMRQPTSSTLPEERVQPIQKATLMTPVRPHRNFTLGPSRMSMESTSQISPEDGSEVFRGVSKETRRTGDETRGAAMPAFKRVPPSRLVAQPGWRAHTHSELPLDSAASRRESRPSQGPTERPAEPTSRGAGPFAQASVPPVDHFDQMQNRWPDLPEERPSALSELLEAVRTLQREKRLDLEQRGEGPWSA
jgi:hypothetical protein